MNMVGTPIEGSRPFCIDGFQCLHRIEALGRVNHRRPMRDGAEVSPSPCRSNDTEARGTQNSITLGQSNPATDEVTIVQNVVVTQSCAPSAAPVVPLVNWMLMASSGCKSAPIRSRRGAIRLRSLLQHFVKIEASGGYARAPNRITNFSCGKPRTDQPPWGVQPSSSGTKTRSMAR